MKTLGLYALVVSLASLAATVQPAAEPVAHAPSVHAALVGQGDGASTAPCRSAACRNGWQAASNNAIYDVADCRQVSDTPGEIDGCKAYVDALQQARLENQW